MKSLINRLAAAAYRRVFNREMSAAEADFVQSLSWVGVGTLIATALTAVFSILGGRLLGPEQYGKYTLIQSIAMFLYIPMLMGFDVAMLRYNAEKSHPDRQKTITSTAYIIIGTLTIISASLMFLFDVPLSGLFATTPDHFRLSVVFAGLFAFFTLTQTTLRSIGRMRAFAVSHIIRAVIMLAAFAGVVLIGGLSFRTMVYSALMASAITALGICLVSTRRYVSFRLDMAWAHTLTRFASAYIIAGISVVIYGEVGKIVVAHYMTVTDVGIYGAYFTATMSIGKALWQVFNLAFFPTASRYKDKRPLLRRINRLVPFIILLGIPFVMGSGYIVLLLYGARYPVNLSLLALFGTATVLFIVRGVYASLLTSEGPRGAFHSSAAALATAAVIITLSILLVPATGMAGAMIAASVAHLVGTTLLLWRGRRYLAGL